MYSSELVFSGGRNELFIYDWIIIGLNRGERSCWCCWCCCRCVSRIRAGLMVTMSTGDGGGSRIAFGSSSCWVPTAASCRASGSSTVLQNVEHVCGYDWKASADRASRHGAFLVRSSRRRLGQEYLMTRVLSWERASERRRGHGQTVRMMSGVNGGIDYEIDLSSLPEEVAKKVEYVQGGPDSPTALIEAAYAIAECRIPSTLPVLVDMLGFNNPIAANIAIDALVRGGRDSIEFLLKGVGAFNYAVNAYALRALGRIGDPAVVDVCIECARGGPIPNVRRAACNALGQLLYEDQDDCSRSFELLLSLLRDSDWSVRYAAVSALDQFKQLHMIEDSVQNIRAELQRVVSEDADRAVQARATLALERFQ